MLSYKSYRSLSYITALSLQLSISLANAQEQTRDGVLDVLSNRFSNSCFGNIDMSSYLRKYRVQSGDTLGSIAIDHNFNVHDLIDIWEYISPERSPNALKVGEEIYILESGYESTYSAHKQQIEQENQYRRTVQAWEQRDLEALSEYNYQITPSRPITTGYAPLGVLGNMWVEDTKRYGPPNVDSRFIEEAVCAHQSRRWDIVGINPNDEAVPYSYRELMGGNDVDAWKFNDFYIPAGFNIGTDFRTFFNDSFSKGVPPINDIDGYYEEISEFLLYLEHEGKPGTKIPTKYLYTNAGPLIRGYENSRNNSDGIDDEIRRTHASHIISYLGNYTSAPFRADYYSRADKLPHHNFHLGIPVKHYIAYMAQEMGDMFYLLHSSQHASTVEMVDVFAEHIIFIRNGKRIHLSDDEADEIRIYGDDEIQIGGAIAMDGFHPYTAENEEERKYMTTRIRPLWSYLLNRDMYLVNTLEPSEEISQIGFSGDYGSILGKLEVLDYIYLKPGEEVVTVFKDALSSLHYNESSYDSLNAEQKREIDRQYILQSYGHQLYGNQSFGGREWRRGTVPTSNQFHEESTTFAYAPIEIFDTRNVERIYAEYINARRNDYSPQVFFDGCNELKVPFISLPTFPGDTKYSLIYRISGWLRSYDTQTYYDFINLSIIQRESIIFNLLGEDIFLGEISAGNNYFIGFEEIKAAISLELAQSPQIPNLVDHRGNPSPDEVITDFIAETPAEKFMLNWSLIIESYVNLCNDCSDFEEENMWNVFENHIISRRAVKDIIHRAEVFGVQDWLDSQGEAFWNLFPESVVQKLEEEGLIDASKRIVRVSSLSDFQIRITYNMNNGNRYYKETWPGKYLLEVIEIVLDENGKYGDLYAMYPQFSSKIYNDLAILKEARELYMLDTDSSRGGDIEKLLRRISFLDSGDQSNLVAKVFWGELQRHIDRENSQNIFQHILESGHNIENVDQLGERFSLSLLFVRNMGGKKALYLWMENYIHRYIRSFDTNVLLPRVETTAGKSNQTIYSKRIFIEHLNEYKRIIAELDSLSNESKELLISGITEIDFINTEADIFSFFNDTNIQELYENEEIEAFILPTTDEFTNKDLFRYTAQTNGILGQRVYKPSLKVEELAYPLIATLILLQSTLSMFAGSLGVAAGVIRKSSKALLGLSVAGFIQIGKILDISRDLSSDVVSLGKKVTTKGIGVVHVLFNSYKKYSHRMRLKKLLLKEEVDVHEIDAYIQGRDAHEDLVLTNMSTHPKSGDYMDGVYNITTETLKVQSRNGAYVLNNEPGNPIETDYKDGKYSFVSKTTQIIRDVYMETLKQCQLEENNEKIAAE